MYIKASGVQNTIRTLLSIRCPFCGRFGTFENLTKDLDGFTLLPDTERYVLSIKRCPHPQCHGLVLGILKNGTLFKSYPAERLDFDFSNIPEKIKHNVEQAITCHSENCHEAAAIMIRRSLEFLCQENGAQGDNLKERIESLCEIVTLPKDLLEGIDHLRLLGNDATHVESRVFSDIGKEHIEVGIEFLKEILKALYQHKDLVSRLMNLKTISEDSS